VSKAKEEGVRSNAAMRTGTMERTRVQSILDLQLQYRTIPADGGFQRRRAMLGKSSQALMPPVYRAKRMLKSAYVTEAVSSGD